MITRDELAALDERASGGTWHLQTGAIGVNPWISVDNWTRKDGSYVRGGCILNMVAHDEREQDAAFIIALVNAYRSGQLVMVPSVECLGDAIDNAFCDYQKSFAAEFGEYAPGRWDVPGSFIARAVLASMGAKTDG